MAAFNIQQSMKKCRINTKQNNNQVNNICFGRLEGSRNTKRGFGRVLARKAKTGEQFLSAGSTGLNVKIGAEGVYLPDSESLLYPWA